MFGMLISILSGALMSIQGVFNTAVTKQSGIWIASGFVQFTALLVCILQWNSLAQRALPYLYSLRLFGNHRKTHNYQQCLGSPQ